MTKCRGVEELKQAIYVIRHDMHERVLIIGNMECCDAEMGGAGGDRAGISKWGRRTRKWFTCWRPNNLESLGTGVATHREGD